MKLKYIRNFFGHLHTINTHRRTVRQHCYKAGIPLQGWLHDLSKYTPTEFLVGLKYYSGDHSPNVEERRELGYSTAWLHHKGRNKHHFEYWFDNAVGLAELRPVEMPLKYVKEMFCDRVAASKVYYGDKYDDTVPLQYYSKVKHDKLIAPKTAALLEELLEMLAKEGEDATFAYIRKLK